MNAVEAADEMTQQKPGVRLSLGVWGDNKDRLNIDVVGMVNAAPSSNGSAPAPKSVTETTKTPPPSQENMESVGAKADDGDDAAVEKLTEAATAANVDPDEFETWMDLGVHLDKGSSSDSEEDYSEYVGYEAVFDSEETGELAVTASAYDKDSGLFTVTDEDDNEYECEFSDLTFEEE